MKTSPAVRTVIAVELPAPCSQKCHFCRSGQNADGDRAAIDRLFWELVDSEPPDEVYVVSSGETGSADGYADFVARLKGRNIFVAAAGAAPVSVIEGLDRIDISATSQTHGASMRALEKARQLGIPFTVSLVDDGVEKIDERLEFLGGRFPESRGYVVRAQQGAGRASEARGETRAKRTDLGILEMGTWPVPAYVELAGFRDSRTLCLRCVDRWGRLVPFVGGFVSAPAP